MTFSIKQLLASITINPDSTTPTFNGTNSNTITFGGSGSGAVRMSAEITNAQGIHSMLNLSVWGLPLTIMNQLSTLGMQINNLPKNQIILSAGDDSGLSQAYVGSILTSIVDFPQPNAIMRITANTAAEFSAGLGSAASFSGKVPISTIMQSIATKMNLNLENNGVTGTLTDTYLYGSPRDQYNTVVSHADIYATIDRGVLAIWPKQKARSDGPISISPTDGTMFGYPAYTANGIMVTALYNSEFGIGKQIKITGSQLPPVNSTWTIYNLNHRIESQMPGGKWESNIFASSANFPNPTGS